MDCSRSVPASEAGTLILGWGNPGRHDDGLGPAFAETVAQAGSRDVTIEVEYQLQVENAEQVARHRRVLFVDADRTGTGPFSLRRLEPAVGGIGFSTHSVAPESVLALSRDLFGCEPEAWLLGIRGYDFEEFGEGLSDAARANLTAAVAFVRSAIESENFREVRPGASSRPDDDWRG